MDYKEIAQSYAEMYRIRRLEESLLSLFSEGKLSGTTHTSIGQEAVAVAALSHLHEGDGVFSNHRCHGHYLAYGGDLEKLLSEIMGKKNGICAGRGGSQHICYKTFFTNGLQGGMLSCAAGYALGNRLKGNGNVAVAFIGDGTLGEGSVYEISNITSLWHLPLLIVVEDNGYAQTTPAAFNRAGEIVDRFRAFQINTEEITSNDILELMPFFDEAFETIRKTGKPCCRVVHTYRLAPHSKGDDFRDPEEIAQWWKKDPLIYAKKQLKAEDAEKIEQEVELEIQAAIQKASLGEAEGEDTLTIGISDFYKTGVQKEHLELPETVRYYESLNLGLKHILAKRAGSLVIGEDIADPYGGSFKVTGGLSTEFPQQLFTTPISEAAIAGISNGLALNQMHPLAEIMFGDFVTLAMDQIVNHAAKFKWMYNNQVDIPVIYRTPTGGKRGYGPTHSQSLESMLFGFPNVTIVAPTHYHQPGQLLLNAFDNADTPVIFVENKGLYSEKILPCINGKCGKFLMRETEGIFPTLHLQIDDSPVDATVICYGGGLGEAIKAAWALMLEEEVHTEIICPALISPVPVEEIVQNISETSKYILVVDEAFEAFGWSTQVAWDVVQNDLTCGISRKVEQIGSKPYYISSTKSLEIATFPSEEEIANKIVKGMV